MARGRGLCQVGGVGVEVIVHWVAQPHSVVGGCLQRSTQMSVHQTQPVAANLLYIVSKYDTEVTSRRLAHSIRPMLGQQRDPCLTSCSGDSFSSQALSQGAVRAGQVLCRSLLRSWTNWTRLSQGTTSATSRVHKGAGPQQAPVFIHIRHTPHTSLQQCGQQLAQGCMETKTHLTTHALVPPATDALCRIGLWPRV